MKILSVGCGNMGGAIISSLAEHGTDQITVVDPMVPSVPNGVTLKRDISELGEQQFDMILVAIKPQMIPDIMPAYKAHLNEDGVLLSIAAGFSIKALESIFAERCVVRLMPNMPAKLGRGMNGLFGNKRLTTSMKRQLDQTLTPIGTHLWVKSEDMLDRFTAIAGSGPGYVLQFIEDYMKAAMELGFGEDEARFLVLETIAGTVATAKASSEEIAVIRSSIVSKNGTTAAGLKALSQSDTLENLMKRTLESAYHRATELRGS